jgi:NTP pyrophosphatase (non-canonical NTP hydrolase)
VEQTVFDKIEAWAKAQNLINGSNPHAQMLKITEEVGELAAAIARELHFNAADAIGDCVVELTIVAAQLGLNIEACIEQAYDEIKDRKGRKVHKGQLENFLL